MCVAPRAPTISFAIDERGFRSPPRQALVQQRVHICGPLPFVLFAELEEIGPRIKPSVVPVIEHDADRVAPHRLKRFDLHRPLARNDRLLERPVALDFSERRLDCVSQAHLNAIAMRLKQRPRKTLGFETPADRLQAVLH
jgi:hypothetical protein